MPRPPAALAAALLALALALGTAAAAGTPELLVPGGAGLSAGDELGESVALSRNGLYAVAGARNEASDVADSGAAFVFHRASLAASWAYQATLKASNPGADDRFGSAVAISDDGAVVAVGASTEDTRGANAGRVYVYERAGAAWEELPAVFAPAGLDGGDRYGVSVALAGDGRTLAVGARIAGTGEAGAVFFHVRSADGASWSEQRLDGPSDGARMGHAVALSADGQFAAAGGLSATVVAVYSRDGDSFAPHALLTDTTAAAGDQFGWAVALSGDGAVLAAGSRYNDEDAENAGSVYVYDRSGAAWGDAQRLGASDAAPGAQLGFDVDVDAGGRYVAAGARYALDEADAQVGGVYLYSRVQGAAAFSEYENLRAPAPQSNDQFGFSVSISGATQTLLASARFEDSSSGSARAYPLELPCDLPGAPALDTAASAVDASGNLVLVVHAPASFDELELDLPLSTACDYGGEASPGLWTSAPHAVAGTCGRTYTLQRALADTLGDCGFILDETSDDDFSIFQNTLVMTTRNASGAVFGEPVTRTVQSSATFQVLAPKSADASSSASAFPSAISFEALARQTVDVASAHATTVTLATSVQWPYVLESPLVVVSGTAAWSVDSAAVARADGETCDDGAGAACTQTWTIPVVNVGGLACQLDGTYSVTFAVSCDPAFDGACDAPAPNSEGASFTLSSASFCASVVEVAAVSAAMTLHSTEAARNLAGEAGLEAADYVFGTRVLGRVDFTVEGGVAVESVSMTDFAIDNACSPCAGDGLVTVATAAGGVDGAVASAIDWTSDGDDDEAAPWAFSYELNSGSVKFDGDAQTGTTTQTLTGVFRITYAAASLQKGRPSTVLHRARLALPAAGGESRTALAATASAALGAGRAEPGSSSNSDASVLGVNGATALVAGAAVVAVVVVAAGVAVLARRRRRHGGTPWPAAAAAKSSSSAVDLELAAAVPGAAVDEADLRTVRDAYEATT